MALRPVVTDSHDSFPRNGTFLAQGHWHSGLPIRDSTDNTDFFSKVCRPKSATTKVHLIETDFQEIKHEQANKRAA